MLNKTYRNNIDMYIFRKNIEENNGPVIELPSQIESNNILVYNNYIGILNKSILSVYSTNGKKEKELEVEISNCIYDTETKITDFIENTSRHLNEKAGCNVVDFLLTKGINMAVAGRFGSKVVEAFRANNIQMIVPEKEIIIDEIIKNFK